jgi:CobQ/CobB/MinD/ParA nucleotide binding domain
MRKLHFILQAKGGVGKSLLTYLLAQTQSQNPNVLFVDVDASTNTSTRQLKFLAERQLESVSLLDSHEKLVRDRFIDYLESLKETNYSAIYFDFGAPESEQFPALISKDLPFKKFMEKLGFQAHFHIVIAGGGAYFASIEYLRKIGLAINGNFEITVWKNITSFDNMENLAEELEKNCKSKNQVLAQFGDFEPHSSLGAEILENISLGLPLEEYGIGAGLKMYQELKENFNYDYEID